MNNLAQDILKFLLEGKAYSDKAIMMNFGIDESQLKEIYEVLKNENFLESYSEYEKRNSNLKTQSGCGSGCSSCSCGKNENLEESCSNKGCCNEKDLDFENILVLTEKAIHWFELI